MSTNTDKGQLSKEEERVAWHVRRWTAYRERLARNGGQSPPPPPIPSPRPFFFIPSQLFAVKELSRQPNQLTQELSNLQRGKARGFIVKTGQFKSTSELLIRVSINGTENVVDGYLYQIAYGPMEYVDGRCNVAAKMGRPWVGMVADVELEDGSVIVAWCVCVSAVKAASVLGIVLDAR